MDTDGMKNLEFNSTFSQQKYHYRPASNFVMIPVALIAIIGVMANIVIIYVIAQFQTLHNPTNWYVLNWSICSVIFLILSTSSIIVSASLEFLLKEIVCVWRGELTTLFLGNVMFVLLLTFDWYSINYCTQILSKTFKRYFRSEIALVWVVVALFSVYINISCGYKIILQMTDCVIACYFIFISVVHVIRVVKIMLGHVVLEKCGLILILISSHFLCCFPNFALICINQFTNLNVFVELYVLAVGVVYCNPIIVLYLLSVYDERFRKCIRTLCKYRNNKIELDGSFESVDLQTGQVSTLI